MHIMFFNYLGPASNCYLYSFDFLKMWLTIDGLRHRRVLGSFGAPSSQHCLLENLPSSAVLPACNLISHFFSCLSFEHHTSTEQFGFFMSFIGGENHGHSPSIWCHHAAIIVQCLIAKLPVKATRAKYTLINKNRENATNVFRQHSSIPLADQKH